MGIDFDRRSGICVLRFGAGSDAERRRITNLLGRLTFRTLRVDCTSVRNLDSTGVRFLVGLLKRVTEEGGEFELLGPHARARDVLRICRYVEPDRAA